MIQDFSFQAHDPTTQLHAERFRILIVDNNLELTRYVARLLRNKFDVLAVDDGLEGLAAVRHYRPDLVLADVMMPGLDGFQLLRAIRADEAIHTVSVIILSGRATEGACLEALDAGADDYLVKPFKPRELIARVRSHVRMARIRRAAVEREGELLRQMAAVRNDLESVLEGTNDAFISLDRDLRIITLNDTAAQLMNGAKPDLAGSVIGDVSPDIRHSGLERALRKAIGRQMPVSTEYHHIRSARWFNVRCYPTLQGVTVFGADISEKVLAEKALLVAHAELESRVAERTGELRKANGLLSAVFDRSPGGIAITDVSGKFIHANLAYQELIGYSVEELFSVSIETLADPEDYPKKEALLQELLEGRREAFAFEMRYRMRDGKSIWVNDFVSTIRDEHQRPVYFVTITQDITDRKRAEREILSSQKELRTLYGRLQTVHEEERLTLAREVHDQLGQILSAAKIDIKLLEEDIRKDAPLSRRKILAELRSARLSLESAIQSVRKIATELRPPELEERGLRAAIEWHARDFERRTRIKCNVIVPKDLRVPASASATALFRIFQEAMTNILRHAEATQVWVSLGRRGDLVVLRIRDNGVGIMPTQARSTRSIGLKGMRERAAIVRGRLMIGPLRPCGTLVTVTVPLEYEAEASATVEAIPH
jgi:PAS domain S-box-containing protein